MASISPSLEQRLLSKAIQQGECLVWVGAKTRGGYGILRVDGTWKRAHRLLFQLHFGPVSSDLVVRHACDNPACINIAHLHIGTQADNVRDMFERGRANKSRGERHPKSKLTDAQVAEVRRRYVPGVYGKGAHSLAKEFGVSKTAMQAILNGEARKD